MRSGNKYTQLIPEKVHQDFSKFENLLSPAIKGYSADYLNEIISTVSCHVRKNEEAAPLQIIYLKKLVPQGDKYLKGLMELCIVQRSEQYIPGKKSYRYNFTPEYKSKYISLSLYNAKLIRRIEKVQTESRKVSGNSIRSHSEQVKYLKKLTLAPGYEDFIRSNYSVAIDQFNSIMGSATRILNGDIRYKVDNTSGRFHSNITNMGKGLRPFLRINGEQLVNIDIKNCQPFLSTLLLTNPSKVSWMTKDPAFAVLLQTLKVPQSEDVKKYISLVNSGQLYEYLMTEFSKEGLELTRDETKRQVLRILFARNRLPKEEENRKARQIFKDRFPKVHRIFSKIRGSEKGDKFTNFKRFAILLQRIESYLMLDIILKRIYKELPGTIAVTIHDSIMTGIITNNVDAVRKIMKEELNSFVGFSPQIKVEGGEGKIGSKERERGEEIVRVIEQRLVSY